MLRAHGPKTLSQQTKIRRVGKSCPSWVAVGNKFCLSYVMFVFFPLTVLISCGCEMLVLNVTKIIWENLFVLNEFVGSLWLVFKASTITTCQVLGACV